MYNVQLITLFISYNYANTYRRYCVVVDDDDVVVVTAAAAAVVAAV